MAKRKPSWRARKFGDMLRELRNANGFTTSEVGEFLRRGQAYVTRFENGIYPIDGPELVKLMDLYKISDMAERERILRDSEEVAKRGWWEGYVTDSGFADFIWAENRASAIKIFQLDTIPGLLQTREFAKALLEAGPHGDDEDRVKRDVEQRVMRSRILHRDNPPNVRFLIHEMALLQRGAPGKVVAGQLRHLRDSAESANVELKILPVTSWDHVAAGIPTGFRILEMSDSWPTLVQIQTGPAGAVVLEDPDVDSFLEAYALLWDRAALTQERSVERITTLIEEVET